MKNFINYQLEVEKDKLTQISFLLRCFFEASALRESNMGYC